jgi:hypothetical protein
MKKILALILISFAMKSSFAQNNDKMIPVKDIRKAGIYKSDDTLTTGFKEGDVTAFRALEDYGKDKRGKEWYVFHFYKMHHNKLRCFMTAYGGSEDYDSAFYHWKNDTTASVYLINSSTKKKSKHILLIQLVNGFGTIGICNDCDESPADINEKKGK